MEKNFNIVSEDSIQHISFYDCDCSRLYFSDNTLIFEMEWMEILPEHPMNPHNKAHQSGTGIVLLKSPILEKFDLYKKNDEINNISEMEYIDFRNILLLQFDETQDKDRFNAKIYLLFNNNADYDSALIELEYKKSISMWNEFKVVSWFEDAK